MLHHVSVGVRDVERAATFYDAVLATLDCQRTFYDNGFAGYARADGAIAGIVGTIQDITELKEAEASLRRTETLFSTIHGHFVDLVTIIDGYGQPGVTGDLAAKKIFPALYAMCRHNRLGVPVYLSGMAAGVASKSGDIGYIRII